MSIAQLVPRATRRLVREFTAMRMVDLAHPLESGMPVFPGHPQFFAMPWYAGDVVSMNQLVVGEHTGTHLDSPAHVYNDPADSRYVPVDRIPLTSVICGAATLRFHGFAVDREVTADEVREWEREHQPIAPATAAIFDFGWAARWGTARDPDYLSGWPGLHVSAAEYLAEKRVACVGTDCPSLDGLSAGCLPVHCVLLEHRIVIVENLCNLENVPGEFLLVAVPLRIAAGSGSPIRPIAVFAPGDTG